MGIETYVARSKKEFERVCQLLIDLNIGWVNKSGWNIEIKNKNVFASHEKTGKSALLEDFEDLQSIILSDKRFNIRKDFHLYNVLACAYKQILKIEANAKLIAAAPELLEACKVALLAMTHEPINQNDIKFVEAVITKAE